MRVKAKKKQPEQDEQIALFEYLTRKEKKYPLLRWIHASMSGIPITHVKTASLSKRAGRRRGVFDVFVPIAKDGYHGLWIEMKIKPNKLSTEQVEFKAFVDKGGFLTAVCYTWIEAAKTIFQYLTLPLPLELK